MSDVQPRPRFYERQYIEAADLMAVVDYARERAARTLLGAHRWGIAIGLELREVADPSGGIDVVLQPGYAWDGFGRAIVVTEPAKIPLALFHEIDDLVQSNGPPPAPQLLEVWIRYDEAAFQGPRPGFEDCETGPNALSRVQERYALEAGPRAAVAQRRDPIEIAGRLIDAAEALRAFDPAAPELVDASVPHQMLPGEGRAARWLIPLGVVRFQPGSPGRFIARDGPALDRSSRARQYAGAVAGSLEAAAGTVRVHDRGKPYSTAVTGELLTVEGDVRADGDVRIYGRRLEFVASHAENPRAPFQALRKVDPASGGSSLNLVIGDKAAGLNTLVVGPRTGVDPAGQDTHAPRLVVTDKGPVGVGVAAPTALLHLAEAGLQIGDSATAEDNFHVQSNTDGARALRFYNKNVGAGIPLLSLTSAGMLGIGETSPSHPLHVKGPLGIRQNALYLSGDSRWSSLTFNAHHNAANTAWEFPDPALPAATIEMDASGGFPRFDVYTTIAGNNRAWISRLRINGHTGDVGVGHGGGSLGVGTDAPTARLDVRGDIVASGDVRLAGLSAIATGSRVRVIWGSVTLAGTSAGGDGYTSAKLADANGNATGRYELRFAAAFAGQPIVLVSRVFGSVTINAEAGVDAGETAVVDFVSPANAIIATADSNGARADGGFTFIAIGPRF